MWFVCMLLILIIIAPCSALCAPQADERKRLRLIDEKGFDDPCNTGAGQMIIHGDRLYVGTWNARKGGKVYRSGDGEKWAAISTGGFGNANNFFVISMESFNGKLYATTWNERDGFSMYRTTGDAKDPSDVLWEKITTNGFGDVGNRAGTNLQVFKDHLYVGCFNPVSGPEVWRSSSGDPGTWTQINQDGWGFPSNSDATRLLAHDDYLYVGTESARAPGVGCQLWRTRGELSPPYDQWEQVNVNGFGSPRNHNTCALAAYKGRLYAGTWNDSKGLEVWRATPSERVPFPDWEQVCPNGFGDPEVTWAVRLSVIGDALYLGALGKFTLEGGLSNLWECGPKVIYAHGGILMRTLDGNTWESIRGGQFLQPPALGPSGLIMFRGRMLIGELSITQPFKLWAYDPSGED